MKKIRLDLDELTVETFDTSSAKEGRGTVRANEPSLDEYSCWHGVGCWNPSGECTGGSCTCDMGATAYPCCEQME